MNSRDRLSAVFQGKPVDRTPVIIPGGMMSGVLYDLLSSTGLPYPDIHTDVNQMVAYAQTLQEICNLDNTGVPFCMTIEAEDFGAVVDLGSEQHEPSIPVEPYDDLESLLAICPTPCHRHQTTLSAVLELAKKSVPVIGNVIGPVSLLTSLVKPNTVFRMMAKKPDKTSEALQHVAKHICHFALEMITAGADFIVIADPSAAGEIIGPEVFKDLVLPVYQKLIGQIKSHQKPIVLHICGRVMNLVPDLENLNWDALSVDSLVSLKKLKAHLPGRLLMGNVSTQIMAGVNQDKTYRASRNLVETTAILSPACGLSTRTPIANIKAMASAAKDAAKRLENIHL